MAGVIHIAGVDVEVGPRLRQRCSWCGAVLVDYDLTKIMVAGPVEPDWRPNTWPVGELVMVDGAMSYVVEHEDGAQLPDGACGKLDPDVTC